MSGLDVDEVSDTAHLTRSAGSIVAAGGGCRLRLAGVLSVEAGEDVLAGRDMGAVCAAVTAGVGLDLGDEV
jgi:hypothetical protein